MNDPNQTYGSAVASIAMEKAIRDAENAGRPIPSDAELKAIGERADALNTYGFDAVQNRDGTWQQQGIGSDKNPSANHFAAIRRYLGKEEWEKAVRDQWRKNADVARKLGLPQPARAS
jgi:hypothetical protein